MEFATVTRKPTWHEVSVIDYYYPGETQAQRDQAVVVFQTVLTGSTGCIITYNPVHPVIPSRMNKPQISVLLTLSVINIWTALGLRPQTQRMRRRWRGLT